jgi:hypothetical protein
VDNEVLIIGMVGAIVSPLVTALGLYLQHQRDKNKVLAETKKEAAEAEKLEAEAKALDIKSNMDTVNFYIGMVNALRLEVNTLTELSRKNGGEIALLTAKLAQSDSDKKKLAEDNAELVKEVQELRVEVAILREQQRQKGEENGITQIT